jgi:hypothetical protein
MLLYLDLTVWYNILQGDFQKTSFKSNCKTFQRNITKWNQRVFSIVYVRSPREQISNASKIVIDRQQAHRFY